MNHQESAALLTELRQLTRGQEQILRSIWSQTGRKGLKSAVIPRSELAKLANMSEPGAKAALDGLILKQYANRTYICRHCGAGISTTFSHAHSFIRCPICGKHLYKHIWIRLELSTKGRALMGSICVNSSNPKNCITLPSYAIELAQTTATLLKTTSLTQIDALAVFLASDGHSEMDKVIALALVLESHRSHNLAPVVSLRGLFAWALGQIDENRKKVPLSPPDPCMYSRVQYAMDRLNCLKDNHTIAATVEAFLCLSIISDCYQENPTSSLIKVSLKNATEICRNRCRKMKEDPIYADVS